MKKYSSRCDKPTVLMIGPYPPPYGGVAIVVRDILNSPLKNDLNIQLVKTQPIGENELKRFIKDIFNIFKKLRKFKPEIVHIQTSYDYGWPKHITYAMICKLFRKHVIIHHHGIPINSKYLKGGRLRYIYPPKFVISVVDHVIAISDEIGNTISKLGKPGKVTVVRNGVNKSILEVGLKRKIKPIKYNVGILYMGAITKRKGIPEFLEMIKYFMEMKLDIDISYSIIGSGELDDYVDSFLEENKLINIIDRRKMISEREKIEILKNNDIFVLQSDHEGLPIAILEAMASGLAIITTPVGGIPDAVKHKENGFLISPHSQEELKNSIKWIINNPNLIMKIKENNIRRIFKDYYWLNNYKLIRNIYHKLCTK